LDQALDIVLQNNSLDSNLTATFAHATRATLKNEAETQAIWKRRKPKRSLR